MSAASDSPKETPVRPPNKCSECGGYEHVDGVGIYHLARCSLSATTAYVNKLKRSAR